MRVKCAECVRFRNFRTARFVVEDSEGGYHFRCTQHAKGLWKSIGSVHTWRADMERASRVRASLEHPGNSIWEKLQR
jgi:hypothetical protein